MKLFVEEISEFYTFVSLEKAWNTLLAQSGSDAPFLRHEWFRIWWKGFGEGKRLAVVTVRLGSGKLVAVAPMMEERGTRFGIPCTIWASMSNDHSCRFEWILSDSAEEAEEAVAAIGAHLSQRVPAIDFFEIQDLPERSRTALLLRATAEKRGDRTALRPALETPFIPIAGDWTRYIESISGHLKRNLRRRRRQLEEQGKVTLERFTGADSGGVAGLLPRLEEGFQIEALAWKGKAGTAIGDNKIWKEFYQQWAQAAAERGWLRLYFLKLDDRRIAFYYTLLYGNKLYYLKLGYDPAYARYSPGVLLHQEILTELFQEGVSELDFLGPTMEWKRDWATESYSHVWLYIFPKGFRSGAVHFLKFRVAPFLKRFSFIQKLKQVAFRKEETKEVTHE